MKKLNSFITEMSAWHNRKNDSIKDQIFKLQRELAANDKEDKERILSAAGIKSNADSTELYNLAMEFVQYIFRANKPYGAILFMLVHLRERAVNYKEKPKAKEMLDKLNKILSDETLIKDLTVNDSAYNSIEKKLKALQDKQTGRKAELDELEDQISQLEKKYNALSYISKLE